MWKHSKHCASPPVFTPNIAFEVDNSGLIFSLLSNQQGVAFMPMVQMQEDQPGVPQQRHPYGLAGRTRWSRASLGLVYRRDYQWSHAARIFAEFLRRWLGTEERDVKSLCGITNKV